LDGTATPKGEVDALRAELRLSREREGAAQAGAAALAEANAALRVRSRMLSAVAEVSTLLHGTGNLDRAIAETLRRIGDEAGLSRVVLFEARDTRAGLATSHHVTHEWCAPGVPDHDQLGTTVLTSDQVAPLLSVLRDGRVVWDSIENVPQPTRDIFRPMDVRATGCVPILVDGEHAATLSFDDCVADRSWTEAQAAALTATANAIGAALQGRRERERYASERERAAVERAAELAKANEAMARSTARLAAEPQLDAFLGTVLVEAAEQAGAKSSALFLFDAAANAHDEYVRAGGKVAGHRHRPAP